MEPHMESEAADGDFLHGQQDSMLASNGLESPGEGVPDENRDDCQRDPHTQQSPERCRREPAEPRADKNLFAYTPLMRHTPRRRRGLKYR